MQYKRVLGIDYGDARIGLALSDLMQIIASPYEVLQNKSVDDSIEQICKIILEKEVDTIVVGLPLNMDNTEGERAKITREFAEKLNQKSGKKIIFEDERLSSFEAEDMLVEARVSRLDRKKIIDKLSACIILESYLNRKEN